MSQIHFLDMLFVISHFNVQIVTLLNLPPPPNVQWTLSGEIVYVDGLLLSAPVGHHLIVL